ncbi:MAG: hypothetical protein LBL75_02790 [Rickettsiales bacterium]|jgi:glutaredoxin|nr:hypothetical protein [Rickettsiales bacterium]
MRLLKGFITAGFIMLVGVACATSKQSIEIFYSPTCPHCHHAMEWIDGELTDQYKNLDIKKRNVMRGDNLDLFRNAMKKCGYTSGAIPVIIVNNDKCFQGYSARINSDIIKALGPVKK